MIVALVVLGGCARGDGGDAVRFDAVLAGQPVTASSPREPIELVHGEEAVLALDLTNVSSEPVEIAHIRLEGRLLDLIFLTYDTGVDQTLAPGERKSIAFPLDFFDLEGQAHGLLRSRLRLFDAERNPLGAQDLVVDGRGSPFATMAVFNLVLAAFAGVSFVWNLYHLARRTLPVNRMARGLRFAYTGVGFGLAISAACSTLRIWPLETTTWLLVTVVAGLCGLAVGYLSPGRTSDIEELIEEMEISLDGNEAPATWAVGSPSRPLV